MDVFQYTNAIRALRIAAVYSLPVDQMKFVDFNGVAAGVSYDVYVMAMIICCLLMLLFALIEHLRPSNKFGCFEYATAILPCVSHQARTHIPNAVSLTSKS